MTSDTLNYTNLNRLLSECERSVCETQLIAMTCAYSMDSLAREIAKALSNNDMHGIKEVTFSNEHNEIVCGYNICVGYCTIELRRIHDTLSDWSRYDTVLAECFYSKIVDDNYGAPVQVVDNVEMDFGSWGYNESEVMQKIPFDWRKFDPTGAREICIHCDPVSEDHEEDITIEDIDLNKFLELEI